MSPTPTTSRPGVIHEPDVVAILAILRGWIEPRMPGEAREWVAEAMDEMATRPTDSRLYRLFSEVAHRCGVQDLLLSSTELAAADAVRPGWTPVDWTLDQAVRLAILLASVEASANDRIRFAERLDVLVRTSDVRELITLYRGLPLYPDAAAHAARASYGCRSNIKPVFEAVAHHDPYPSEAFQEGTWNQMVLKALFVGSALDPIVGLDARANPRLTAMLRQYAGERRAASRPVSPELWRCVGRAPDAGTIHDLRHLLEVGTGQERRAAVLALRAVGTDEAAAVLADVADLNAEAAEGTWGWSDMGAD
jgi:hypothetical protein